MTRNGVRKNPMLRDDCVCAPPRARGKRAPLSSRDRRRAPPQARRPNLRERVDPCPPDEVEPIVLAGSPGATCRPFLTIQKDPDRFAACNALADEIGPLNDPKNAFRLLEEAIGDEVNEVFGVVTLDLHLRMKSMAETGRGEPSSVMAPLVPTLQAAVADGAQAAIIYHVHPSGIEAEPSQADIETTQSFVEAFETVGIPLLDHIIVAGDARNRSYYSFAEDNAL